MTNYARTPTQLRKKAVLYWPDELAKKEKAASIMPRLLSTQDKFISILDVSDSSPEAWKHALAATNELPANLFLKHLMILSDVGGEPLQRIRTGFGDIFPEGFMAYSWKGKLYQYVFTAIPTAKRLTNSALFVDGRRLQSSHALEPLMEDVIMLLLHGAAATDAAIPDIIKDRCVIGSLMGDCAALKRFVKERYIWASRMTGNTTPSRMKLVCRDYLGNMLVNEFPDWQILPDSSLPADSNIPFDIVATSPSGRAFAIEVIFCYATERTLEQKAKLADVHAALAHKAGHRIVYVIANPRDIKRISALSAICRNSDCTVAFTPKDLNGLVEFLYTESEQTHA